MTCRRCATPGSFATSSDQRCAFAPDGRFRSGGIGCGTIDALLKLATFKVPSREKGLHIAFVRGDGDTMLIFGWRKSMARIECARVWGPLGDGIETAPFTLDTAEAFLASAGRTG